MPTSLEFRVVDERGRNVARFHDIEDAALFAEHASRSTGRVLRIFDPARFFDATYIDGVEHPVG